jgi:hypothetical protein
VTIVDTRTGEITEPMTAEEAKRLTERIRLLATSLADQFGKVAQLIEQARDGDAASALGYRSWTEYVEHEFMGAFAGLSPAQRQPIAQQFADAGTPTRTIAAVTGVSQPTAYRDVIHRESPDVSHRGTPAPEPRKPSPIGPEWDHVVEAAETGADIEVPEPSGLDEFLPEPPKPTPITGRDGKTYQRPTPNPIAEAVAQVKSEPAVLAAKAMGRLVLVTKTVEAAGGADAILASLKGEIADAQAPLWLDFIDQAYAALDPLRAGLRRRNLRSVR